MLEKGLEEQRRANLDTVDINSSRQINSFSNNGDGNLEKELVTQEKIQKLEGEVTRMRSESLKTIDELDKQNKKILDLKLQVSQKEIEIEILNNDIAQQKVERKQLSEMNTQIQSLKIENNGLVERLLKQSQQQIVSIDQADSAKKLLETQEELIMIKNILNEFQQVFPQ